ncbi:MAG: efflux RND transporter periplasmic adaptor subunit [candidate division Zixibacteria bacterium]|nr:efflux RND transporter periplasmic adaptor subunit [candidate division Zixibacteria bacterium]
MKTNNRWGVDVGWVIALVLILLLVAGCAKNSGGGFAPPPMPVEVATVTSGTVADKFEAVGTLEALEAITVVSQIDALAMQVPFEEGRYIEKGQLIARLDDEQLKAEEARAEALRDQRKISYDRVKSIVEQKAGAPQDLDDAAAALKMAEAELALIRARLAKTKITAPFSGLVGARRVSPGAFVRTGEAITELAQIDELRIIFYAPERYLADLKAGASVVVSTPAFPGYSLKGRVSVVEPVVNPETRSVKILARVANPARKFRPGMSANVSAVLSERKNALLVPDEAIFAEGNKNLVYVIQPDSSVAPTPVILGTRLPDAVEVLSGLSAGAQVVKAGHQKLFPGAKVFPVPDSGAPPPGRSGSDELSGLKRGKS